MMTLPVPPKRTLLAWMAAVLLPLATPAVATPAVAMPERPTTGPEARTRQAHSGVPACTPFTGTFPIVDPIVDDYHGIRYRKWDDICFGDAAPLGWQEWKAQNDWQQGVSELARRFDYYRPTNANVNPHNRKLVIWAHPNGLTEDLVRTTDKPSLFKNMLVPLLRAGYAVMAVETRHPASSFVSAQSIAVAQGKGWAHPVVAMEDVPGDDIATAVRWAKFNGEDLNFDGENVVLVGQSRGSFALVNALRVIPGEPTADWRSQDNAVKGVFVHQAQTTFREDQVAETFLLADTAERLHRTWFRQDFPDMQNTDPLSAIDLAGSGRQVPVYMAYEGGLTLKSDKVTIKPQCYESNNENWAWQGFDTPPPRPCVADLGVRLATFDVHDPNYSQVFAQAYEPHAPGLLSRCLNRGKNKPQTAYADIVEFVDAATAPGPFTYVATCSAP